MTSSKNDSPLTAISIFTGAGGLDIGFERAGFSILSAVELHPTYCETIRENQKKQIPVENRGRRYFFQDTSIINDDIANVSGETLLKGMSLGEIDCLIGGPPCQSFSSAGKQRSIFDKRGTLVYEYLRVLKETMPKTFLFENVRGLVTAKGHNREPGEILTELLKSFYDLGYSCRVALLNAAEYGAYQARVRCFIMGSRIAAAPYFPPPQYGKTEENALVPEMSRKRWRTLGEFLKEYADTDERNWVRPTQAMNDALKGINNGSGLKSSGRVEATRPGGHWGYRQGTFIADLDKPARTVTGSSSQDWIRLADGSLRRLTLKEVIGLQGFPNEWIICGTKSDQFQQVGNAVPTVFGELLGTVLKEYLFSKYLDFPRSNPMELPSDIQENIRYTKYDNLKNGRYRANAISTPVGIESR
ncbi:MAG: DNA cytosine methyltransferase [Kiritimatiellae bacterium]|nr:DNA cytosine methyltransferase [Kiritimatiellia bacterium]